MFILFVDSGPAGGAGRRGAARRRGGSEVAGGSEGGPPGGLFAPSGLGHRAPARRGRMAPGSFSRAQGLGQGPSPIIGTMTAGAASARGSGLVVARPDTS